jgi:hypothetical protein
LSGTKECRLCRKLLPLDRFHIRSGRRSRRTECIDCYRAADRRKWKLRKYGLSEAGYDRLLGFQGGVCAICGVSAAGSGGKWGVLVVDHCHRTGKVRGLLCTSCNVRLAKVGDSLEGLRPILEYLQSPPAGRLAA